MGNTFTFSTNDNTILTGANYQSGKTEYVIPSNVKTIDNGNSNSYIFKNLVIVILLYKLFSHQIVN